MKTYLKIEIWSGASDFQEFDNGVKDCLFFSPVYQDILDYLIKEYSNMHYLAFELIHVNLEGHDVYSEKCFWDGSRFYSDLQDPFWINYVHNFYDDTHKFNRIRLSEEMKLLGDTCRVFDARKAFLDCFVEEEN